MMLPPIFPLPLDAAKPTPSEADRQRVVSYAYAQAGSSPSGLSAWLCRRKEAYYAGPGQSWGFPLICYAACRDALMHRLLVETEQELWEQVRSHA